MAGLGDNSHEEEEYLEEEEEDLEPEQMEVEKMENMESRENRENLENLKNLENQLPNNEGIYCHGRILSLTSFPAVLVLSLVILVISFYG